MKNLRSVLFLHGFAQNAIFFSKQVKVFSNSIEKKFNLKFIFPNAPFLLDPNQESIQEETKQYGWLYFDEDNKLTDMEMNRQYFEKSFIEYKGFKTTQKTLEEFIIGSNCSIECLIGFSQGALVVNLFLIQAVEKKLQIDLLKYLKCCILISGIGSPLPLNSELEHVKEYACGKKHINVPVLIIIGKKDQYVKRELTEKLAKYYSNYEIYEHEGMHIVPSRIEDIDAYIKFLDKYIKV